MHVEGGGENASEGITTTLEVLLEHVQAGGLSDLTRTELAAARRQLGQLQQLFHDAEAGLQ
jgi:hypothetical protein